MKPDPRIGLLLAVLDQAYDSRGWHGTTLRGAVQAVDPAEALWRPMPNRHCIWDLVLHCAYWKYAVRRRLAGAGRRGFPRSPSNWPRVPDRPDERAWGDDLELLDAEHASLRQTVVAMSGRQLDARSPRGAWRNIEQIHGVAAHDVYHTGQIQLLKRLMKQSR